MDGWMDGIGSPGGRGYRAPYGANNVCLQLGGQREFDNKFSESSKQQQPEQEQEQEGEEEEEMIELRHEENHQRRSNI